MALLRVGERAPQFSATTSLGQRVTLEDFLGQRTLILFFYPRDGTPVCTKEACAFRDAYAKFVAAGAEVLGICGDPDSRHRQFAEQHRLPFPLISDANGSLRKAFGVRRRFGLLPGRATFVIDKQGIIRLIYSALFASDEHVRRALAAATREAVDVASAAACCAEKDAAIPP